MYLPPLTIPLVQMADMEIPVNVVTTTLREITMTPRPERSQKRVFFNLNACIIHWCLSLVVRNNLCPFRAIRPAVDFRS